MQRRTWSYLRRVAQSLPVLIAGVSVSQAHVAAKKVSYPHMAPLSQYLSKSVADEMALARTAAPASVSGKARVLTLGRHGYEVAMQGTNGFVCLVQRSWEDNFDNIEFWDPGVRTPMCYNTAAAQSLLSGYLERTEWVLSGTSLAQMAARTKPAAPMKGAMVYMMSRQQLICGNEGCDRWYPHVMFFFPNDDVPNWGANQNGGPVYSGHFNRLTTVFFVLVPTWSDGTPSPAGNHNM